MGITDYLNCKNPLYSLKVQQVQRCLMDLQKKMDQQEAKELVSKAYRLVDEALILEGKQW